MICFAIFECAKRSLNSDQKTELIAFFEKFSSEVLQYCEIDKTSELYTWNGTDWINNIIENNPVIIQGILDQFENILADEFKNYAIELDYNSGNYVYELCGVYWHVVVDSNSDLDLFEGEVNGPSTDKDWIMDFMP